MVQFSDWCSAADASVGPHALRILSGDPARLNIGVAATATIIPSHYASEEHISRILSRLGKPGAAKFISEKLPTTKSLRSGDLGEILVTEYIVSHTGYEVPIKRLRWKDHRNMAMRGDDVIGIAQDQTTGRLQFLKTEAKSRVTLNAGVVAEARTGLNKDGGLPSAHTLALAGTGRRDGQQMRRAVVAQQPSDAGNGSEPTAGFVVLVPKPGLRPRPPSPGRPILLLRGETAERLAGQLWQRGFVLAQKYCDEIGYPADPLWGYHT